MKYQKFIIPILIGLGITLLTKNFLLGILVAFFLISRTKRGVKMRKKDPSVIDINFDKKTKLSIGLIIASIIVVIYIFRPWFHDFLIIFYKFPLLGFALAAIIAGTLLIAKKKNIAVLLITLGVISMFTLSFNDLITQNYIVQTTEYNKIETLPDSTAVRMLPMPVAFRYLQDSLQKSRERLGGLDIVALNNTLVWTAPRVPDGAILYFTQKVNGLMVADADTSKRNTKLVTEELTIGEEIGIFDNIYWTIYKKKFFMDVGEIFYLMDGDEIITVVSVIGYKFRFPVMVPYFDGAFKIKANGDTTYVKAADIANDPLFKNNVVYPESLTRLYVDSYKYHLGVMNAWFLHEDQIEISDVYGQENRQPFLLPIKDGLKWVIATEPYGESFGIFKIFIVDAVTGNIELMELNEDQTLTGPVRVVSYVKQKFPIIDWATSRVVEPRPYVANNKLYWMLSITPIDYAGISYTVFVDTETNEVLAFDTDEKVYDFIQGGVVPTDETEIPDDTSKSKEALIDEKILALEKGLAELKELLA